MKQAFRYLLILACYLAFVGDSTADAVTVTLWDQEQGMTRDVLQELVETFNGRYKTTKIQMIHMKSESVRDALEKKKGSDNLPDLLVGDQEIAGAFGKSGLLRNLKTYTNWKRFEGKVVGSVTDKPGRIWGWPLWQNQQMLMFVNRKMVPKIPDDYDSLLEAAKKNSNPENGQYGFAFPLMEPYCWLTLSKSGR